MLKQAENFFKAVPLSSMLDLPIKPLCGIIAPGFLRRRHSSSGNVSGTCFCTSRSTQATRQYGFTLVEIMVVLIILVTLMTVFGGKIFGAGDKAKANITKIKLAEIESYIEQYRLQYNKVPGSLNSLVQCTEETGSACTPIANAESLADGWGTPFVYAAGGDGRSYTVKSLGADAKDGGSGVDGDLVKQGP